MAERFGLRLRFALFFAALAAGGGVLIAGALWLGWSRAGGPADGYAIAGLAAIFGLAGLTAWIALLFDENVAKPILALSAELETRAGAGVSAEIDAAPARYLGALAPAAQSIHRALEHTRASLETALAEKLALMERDKALLEALLRELADAIVVFSGEGRILLFNREAVALLGPLGLDRPLEGYLRTGPVHEAVLRLRGRGDGGQERPETCLTTTVADGRILTGAVSAVPLGDDRTGHVLLFRDTTEALRTHGGLERLLRQTIEGARRPAAAMAALLDVVQADPDLPGEARARIDAALREELDRLSAQLADSAGREADLSAGYWPIADIAVQQIFDALILRGPGAVRAEPTDACVRCDGYAVTEILGRALAALGAEDGRGGLVLSAEAEGEAAAASGRLRLCLDWQGPSVPLGEVEGWLAAPLAPGYGPYTGRDALEAHRTETWVEPTAQGARLVLPLQAAALPMPRRRAEPLDFYDFNLPAHLDPDLGRETLRNLSFAVFDTETTGLDPARDAVVQIAAVRVLGGRLLRGESFDRLVDPGRPIPGVATTIHGLTDAMVSGAPPFAAVAADFAGFAEGCVLVAHHAAFDMAFFDRLAAEGGPVLDRPVLCTALLSSRLFEHTGDHTLDGLAGRLGVEIPAETRHTALGDSVATAEVMRKLVPLLEARGVGTLAAALEFQRGV